MPIIKILRATFFLVMLALATLSAATTTDVRTYRDDHLGFEISYPQNWSPISSPDNPAFSIRRNSVKEAATLSIDVAPDAGDSEAFLRELRKNPEVFVATVRARFPDAQLRQHGETFLGGFPAYLLRITYTLRNPGAAIPIDTISVLCLRAGRLYVVHLEAFSPVSKVTFREFRASIASFNFR